MTGVVPSRLRPWRQVREPTKRGEVHMSFRNSKVVIVGAGNVGSTTAFSIVSQGLCEDVCLIDINKEVAEGQALDMQDAVYF
ncbi:lactate/malate family dehydrogenase, partial [Parafannyhessea umbonata]|uniref:lactate/malate family dehydrogenase n=1 Tax=Parafannyhessea umbonata TaxID=604330 RepID=UPI003F6609BA